MARDVFTAPIDSIAASDVAQYVSSLTNGEGYTFEVKADGPAGTGRLGADAVAKAVCSFANGRLVGVLVVGAAEDKTAGTVTMRGLNTPPRGPLKDWLDSAIRNTVRPQPHYEIRAIRAATTHGPVALVRVSPQPLGPTLAKGRIYVRTATGSVPLEDPSEVARLFREAEQARARAEHVARADVRTSLDSEITKGGTLTITPVLRMALAPAAVPETFQSQVLRKSYVQQELPNALQSVFPPASAGVVTLGRLRPWGALAWTSPSALLVAEVDHTGWARLTVAAPGYVPSTATAVTFLDDHASAGARFLCRALTAAGAEGPAYLGTEVGASGWAGAWVEDLGDCDTHDVVAMLKRQHKRGLGLEVYEPEP